MGCRGRPLFDLNELPNEGDEENDGVLNLQPQRALPSLSSHATDLFAPSEGGQRILNSSAFSHEPSVSGFQPFVRPKEAQIVRNVKQETSNHVNSNDASSSKIVDKTVDLYEEKKEVPLPVPVSTHQEAQTVEKEEGEWSDADGSVDTLLTNPTTNKDEGLKTDKLETEINQGITETIGVRSSDKVSESTSREIMNTECPRDEVIDTGKDNITHGSYRLDTQQSELNNNTVDGQEEPSSALKQRDVKGVEAIHALKSANNHGKKHKLDHHKEAMLGKKRSRQTMFLNLEDVKQAGSIKTLTPRRQPVSSTLISRPAKEVRTLAGFPERNVERQGQPTSIDQKPTDISNNEVITPMEYIDHKFDSNGDMNAGIQSRTSRINNLNDVPSEVYPPSIPRQGSLKQATDARQIKNPPSLSRRSFGGGQSSEIPKVGSKKLPPVKKQPMNNNTQYNDTSVERLLREVTNDKFWHHPEVTDLQCVPGRFESVEEYVRVFEPLLFEECRAQLYSTWEEQLETVSRDSHVMVRVRSVERRERGWYDVILLPTYDCKWTFKEGDVAVLSCPRPGVARPKRSEDDVESEVSGRVAGTVRRHIPIDTRDPLGAIFHFYVGDTYDPNSNEDDHVLKKLQPKGIWYLTILGTLATTQREYIALHAFQRLNLQMQTAILRPSREQFPKYEEQSPAMPECFTTNFVEHLHRSFNGPQLSAIQWAAMHTASGTSSVSKRQDPWPFTLVQGPPGTGKTHTVWGMLNVIHLVQYQHYYTALLKKLAPESYKQPIESNPESVGTGSIDEVLQSMDQNLLRTLPKLCPKPRMLVCAPSNAATDELLTRVLDRGFIDGEMKVYRPDVARVGVDTQTRAAQAVSVERRTEQLLAKGRDEIVSWMHQLKIRESQLATQINCLQRELTVAAAAGRSQGSVGVDPDILVARDQNRDTLLQNLAAVVEGRDKVLVEMSRLYIVEGKFRPGSNFNLEDARSNLEASFANEAEILFTTVSSSGRKLFSRLTHGFDMVVIDEAAQASEVGVLPPLALSAARCVLVGDPQQLPATVISKAAGTLLYSRSLFERFQQAGCPTILLSVQYRMHPQIRDFPSRYFYQGRLTDSESVSNLPDEIYYKDPLLRPYVFYDVTHGRESHRGGSVSYQNIHEAQFCFRIYEHLQRNLKSLGASKVTVGIITPYKLQLKCLQREFDAVLNTEEGKDIYINTVDAFQGQERDVIIMSCVRASNHGVGFVSDVRRMNVALTRAKRALWVMGNANSLMRSDDWAALITDAKARNCYLDMESLPKEFLSVKNTPYTSLPMKPSSNMRNSRTGGGGRHRHFDMHNSHTDSKSGTPSEEDEKSLSSAAATVPIQRNGAYRNNNYSKALLIENNNNNSTMDDAMQMAEKSRDAWQYGIQQKKQQNSAGVLGGTKRDS